MKLKELLQKFCFYARQVNLNTVNLNFVWLMSNRITLA